TSWEMSPDGTTYTFVLREDVKWSGGAPFTADDLVFCYEGVLLNPDLTPVVPSWLQAGGETVEIVKIDDNTVEFRFAAPNTLLLRYIAYPPNGLSIITPAHYLKQFHPD